MPFEVSVFVEVTGENCFNADSDSVLTQVTELGIEGAVPLEMLTAEVKSKLHGKSLERSKQKGAKKDQEGVVSVVQADDSQASSTNFPPSK